jgi:hypothetical protein
VIEKLMYNLEEIHEMMQPRKAVRWIASNPSAQQNTVYDTLLRGLLAGFVPMDEPYLRHHLLKMQEKAVAASFARIRVPSSAYAFGVVDHTETLEEGEVFFHPKSANPWHSWGGCIRGKVMVTRNPCYHPGMFVSNENHHSHGETRKINKLVVLTIVIVHAMHRGYSSVVGC